MKPIALLAVRLYQRHLSPHKGFVCAYRVHTGRCSCSEIGFRAIRRFGVIDGCAVLRERLNLCGVAHRRFAQPVKRLHPQAGMCDLSCGALDLDGAGSACDVAFSGCDCSGWDNKKKNQQEEKWIYIPPNQRLKNDVRCHMH